MTTKVKLRKKPISGKRQSLYLDFYPAVTHPKTGDLTRREFLGLYINDKPKTAIDKQHNKETEAVAEQIRQRRDNELNKPEIYSGFEKEQLKIRERGEACFVEYFKELADKRKASNHDNWISAYHYLDEFTKGGLRFADLDEKFCSTFRDHLLTAPSHRSTKKILARNSAVSYFNKFQAALKQAFKDGFLQTNLNGSVESIKPEETKRNFLTIPELNKLIETECNIPILKKAALFSALTGLRFSDIEKMTWIEVLYISDSGYFLDFRQQKTQGVELLPISEQAFKLLGERMGSKDRVFPGLVYSAWMNGHLFKWVTDAGIKRNITFHCFRHTFATLQLSKGTDLYTVSKMLGHRDLKTTQIYGKIIDKTKRDAADRIQLNF